MHRYFIEQKLKVGDEIKLPDEAARQITQVLRMRVGDKIILFNGDGFDYSAAITAIDKKEVRAKITAKEANNREPTVKLTLFQSVIKKDKMEWVAEKCTEIGITKLVPVLAERSVKTGVNETRLKKILKEAAEQSGRAIVPELSGVISFNKAIEVAIKDYEIVYLAHTGINQPQNTHSGKTHKIGLFIGPEGGFSDAEISASEALGAKIISLGSTILRAETAAVMGAYRLVNNF